MVTAIFSMSVLGRKSKSFFSLLQEPALMAFQIGFDLYESATQKFLARIQGSLKPVGAEAETPTETKTE